MAPFVEFNGTPHVKMLLRGKPNALFEELANFRFVMNLYAGHNGKLVNNVILGRLVMIARHVGKHNLPNNCCEG